MPVSNYHRWYYLRIKGQIYPLPIYDSRQSVCYQLCIHVIVESLRVVSRGSFDGAHPLKK
jgi:hypothetical protein